MSLRNEQHHQVLFRSMLISLLAGLITLWGLLAIYRTLALTGNWEHFLLRQGLWAAAAWIVYLAMSRLDWDFLKRAAMPAAAVGAVTLLLLPICGMRINGMCGWYSLGALTLQPSEICKGFYILALVKVMQQKNLPEMLKLILALMLIGIFALLLFIQPDFGTMIVYLTGGACALYFCNVRKRFLFIGAAAAVCSAAAAIVLHPYMQERILNFLNPEADPSGGGWHLRQFAIAVSRGEWFGVKGDMAVWSNSFLPLSHNDSIFAAMCEMLGFTGGAILLGLYTVWFYQMFALTFWRRDPFRRALIASLAAMIIVQTFLHIAVNLSLIPPTGITLPLVSYGGSSLVGTMIMLAIINIAGRSVPNKS